MDDKKANMPAPSRWENRQKALEQKRKLAERLTSSLAQRKTADSEASSGTESSPAEPPRVKGSGAKVAEHAPRVIPAAYGRAGVRLHRDSADAEEVKASRALEELVNITFDAAQTRERIVVLQWPGVITRLPLVHVLATLERWARGDKQGLRAGLYPARANSFDTLNHVLLDREDVLRWARELVENPAAPNASVTRSFPDKDAFLFSLSALSANGGEELHPTAGELIPRFAANADFGAWPNCSGRLLENVAARMSRRYSRSLRREQCVALGAPENAPDAVFSLRYSMAQDDLRKALRALARVGAPEVFLIDATRPARRAIGANWAKRLGEFVALVHRTFPKCRPGLVLVADEPQVAEHLRHVCIEECMRLDKDVRQLSSTSFTVHASPCPVLNDGLIPSSLDEPRAPKPLAIQVRATDADAARVVATLEKYAAQCPGGRPASQEVVEGAQFIHRLSVLPSSVRHLMDWLEEVGAEGRLRDKFTWLYYRGRLNEFIERTGRGREPEALNRALKTADELWTKYQSRTAFAEQLVTAVGFAASSPKHVAVVFDRPLRRRLAERFLLDYQEFPGGKRFSEFKERVRLILGSDLESQLAESWATRYVFAGVDDRTLRTLIVDDRLPPDSLVLLAQRSAQYLHGVLRRVLQYPAFGVYKPRIESMERQLASFAVLDDKLILRIGDMALPDFDYQAVVDSSRGSDERADQAFEIVLERGRRIYRGRGSEMFLYDPANPLATDRGFRRISVDSLQAGDRLFDMSPDLRERVEDALKEAGVPIQRDKRFEASLRKYHEVITQAVNAQFSGPTLAAVARQLRARMVEENPGTKTWPTEAAVRHWIDLGKNPDVPFESLQPQAPMKREHYFALCKALRLNDVLTQYFLYQVIQPIRNARRLDGRYVSDTYSHMLLEPESVMVHAGLRRGVVEDLFARALENVYAVEAVHPPHGEG